MNHEQVHELLYQALETELGGIQVYHTALQCTVNAELKHEWQEYLAQTETHTQILRALFATLKLNPDQETAGRQVVRHIGQSLVTAMEMALHAGEREAAQLVATECVIAAETKDHGSVTKRLLARHSSECIQGWCSNYGDKPLV